MPKRMLIDASHPEETRVVVLDGQRVDEFDFEAASKRPLKGNIYLAKVTRVEPSLQAAFVEYGGNRQGFLAFSEIHPDYYQIPVADRQALLAEQQEEARRRSDDEFESVATGIAPPSDAGLEAEDGDVTAEDEPGTEEHRADSELESGFDAGQIAGGSEKIQRSAEHVSATRPTEAPTEEELDGDLLDRQRVAGVAVGEGAAESSEIWSNESGDAPETFHEAGDDPQALEPAPNENRPAVGADDRPAQPLRAPRPPHRWVRRRHYKIQEVIKRKQIMLVQVVKEERGTKGAALTTYLSLAGRYCVLMPNTPRGGGISRKITNAADRNRLKAAASTLELPEGMGLIIRTAGANRTKLEIKRDYEYLLRMWDQIRELTLQSNAPACVYEEGDIIKRAIRDVYNKDVSEVLVEGEEGYKNAKEFMRMLMPSHAKNVKLYRDVIPVFQKYHIEAQLDAMFQPTVTLKSGGYIVINQTEALVSIDVNSGRATREHSIEETAHKTNLEAADEVARQLRLRDLAGLIVIDFIDMEDSRNDRDVEKRLREAAKNDRARVQIGKISQFGLLEMSRQRLRAGVVASSTIPCPHCGGQGIVRSVESTALRVIRALDEEGQRGRAAIVVVHVANEVALYALNQKRREIARIEADYDMGVGFEPKEGLIAGTFEMERSGHRTQSPPIKPTVSVDAALTMATDMSEPVEEETTEFMGSLAESPIMPDSQASNGAHQNGSGKKRRRRRRGRGHRPSSIHEPLSSTHAEAPDPSEEHAGAHEDRPAQEAEPSPTSEAQSGSAGTSGSRRRRRRRRKPHQISPNGASNSDTSAARGGGQTDAVHESPHEAILPFGQGVTPNAPSEPVWSLDSDRAEGAAAIASEPVGEMYSRREKTMETAGPEPEAEAHMAHNRSGGRTAPTTSDLTLSRVPLASAEEPEKPESPRPQRRGWWQRPFKKT